MSTAAIATIGHNNPPADPIDTALEAIQDLYDEAKNFADGEAIESEVMHDTITKLYDSIHEAGKAADALRVEEKRPLDDQINAIQSRFNPFIQPKKGKVDLAKSALGTLLAAWRKKIADEKAAVVAAARAEAERLAEAAREAHRAAADKGNLEATEAAETMMKEAAAVNRFAKQAEKGPSGLRSVWKAEPTDWEAGLDWAYARAPEEFRELVQQMANTAVRAGMRTVPGFRVFEEHVAT